MKKCSISNDLGGTEDDVLWAEQNDKSDTDSEEEGDDMYDEMVIHEQIQQMFCEEADYDEFWGSELILLILVHLIRGFNSRGVIGPKTRCILYMSAYNICEYIRYMNIFIYVLCMYLAVNFI